MPVHVSWHDEKNYVLWIQFDGNWTITEFREAIPKIYEMIESTSERVDSLVDLRTASGIPKDIMVSLRGSTARAPDNWGAGVIVGAGLFVETLLKSFRAIYPSVIERYWIAGTVEEALNIIYKLREDKK